MVPIQVEESEGGPWPSHLVSKIYLTAFCKAGREMHTEEIPVDATGKALLSHSALPRTGCRPIDDLPI